MPLHLLVGAIWAVFYAYFFWSVLPLRPALQGLVFAFVPMPLAIFIMHPQLDLMHPLVQSRPVPSSGLFGLSGGVHEPLSIAVGHLIWGTVLGLLYTRPVGFPANRPPRLVRQLGKSRPSSDAAPRDGRSTGSCSRPASSAAIRPLRAGAGAWTRWRPAATTATGAPTSSSSGTSGLRYLRYGPPLHLIHRGPGQYDWAFLDEVAAEMQRLGIVPIMDLCHFGLPDWLQNFQNPEVPHALADYARAFARRYPWVRLYTPVNEMYVCAKLSALEGLWNEQCRDERAFVTAVRHLAKANVLMMQAIAAERPDAVFVNSESGEFYQPCCPDPEIRRIAEFENERRFLPLDLLYARPVHEGMRAYLTEHGMPAEEYAWFMQQDVRQARDPRRRLLRMEREAHRQQRPCAGAGRAVRLVCRRRPVLQRYRRPMMHTETNRMDAREGPRWLWRQWHNVQLIRQTGVPVVGFTWYSLTDQVDWDIALREPLGNVNPVGLFDLNRDPRTVGLAYQHLVRLFDAELSEAPSIEAVLEEAAEARDSGGKEDPCLGCCRPMALMPARRNGRCWPALSRA